MFTSTCRSKLMTTTLLAMRTCASLSVPRVKISRAKPFSTTAVAVALTASAAAGRGDVSASAISANSARSKAAAMRTRRGASRRLACLRDTSVYATRPAILPFLAGLQDRANLGCAS